MSTINEINESNYFVLELVEGLKPDETKEAIRSFEKMAQYIINHQNELIGNEFEVAAMAIVRKIIKNIGSCDIQPSVIHETYNNEYQKTISGDRIAKAALATAEKLSKCKTKF